MLKLHRTKKYYMKTFFCLFVFLMMTTLACGSSQAKNQILALAEATLDPLNHCARPGIEPTPLKDLSCCSQILNPLCHRGNSNVRLSRLDFLECFIELVNEV